jgi:hypothetical protein
LQIRLLVDPLQPQIGFRLCLLGRKPVTVLQLLDEVLTPGIQDLILLHFNGSPFSDCTNTLDLQENVELVQTPLHAFQYFHRTSPIEKARKKASLHFS